MRETRRRFGNRAALPPPFAALLEPTPALLEAGKSYRTPPKPRFGGSLVAVTSNGSGDAVPAASKGGRPTLAGRGIQKRVPADARQVPALRHAVEDFANAHCELGDVRAAVALCVTEACSNVVRHAYPDGGGELSLVAWMD